jgi:hypothetical protein
VTYDLHLETADGVRIEPHDAEHISALYDHCEARLAAEASVKKIHLHLGDRRLHTIVRRDGPRGG